MPSSEDNKYAPTAWNLDPYIDLTFPSGQLAQVRRPGVPQLIDAGVLDSADTLGSLVDQKHLKRVKGQQQIDPASLMKDSANLITVMQLVDKVTAYMVIQPAVAEIWVEEMNDEGKKIRRKIRDDERDPNVVYCDVIGIEDRMFLFQYAVGGSTDLATFRERFQAAMGSVEAIPSVSRAAKQPVRS
jgi:hypothetical protein